MLVSGSSMPMKPTPSEFMVLQLISLTDHTSLSYFVLILCAFSSPPFYSDHVHLPSASDPVPPLIFNNPKSNPFFKDAIGCHDSFPMLGPILLIDTLHHITDPF